MENEVNTSKSCKMSCSNLAWWATLVVAVLAVPSFGVVIAFMAPFKGILQIGVFILACWLCTYLGMQLMKKPGMSNKINPKM